MEEENIDLELVISDGKNVDLDDDIVLPPHNDEDTIDLTEIINEVQKNVGDNSE